MTYIPNWEEFEKSAEMLYLRDPMNVRYSTKYTHSKGVFSVKVTDNKKVNVMYIVFKIKLIKFLIRTISRPI